MGKQNKQAGFFDREHRQEKLLATRDFLERVRVLVDWEAFRPMLDAALKRSSGEKGGRPPFDAVLMFRILVLQALYNLSDEQTEYQILDRLSFARFLGLELHDTVPDARTIWVFREALIAANAVEKLFAKFDAILANQGFAASGGQIIDATFVEMPRQRNSREENKNIKDGKTPADWSEKKVAHKDVDARWTKKNDEDHYGYKNHANVDRTYKLIRRYTVTDASVHDSQEMDAVLDKNNASKDTWADSAYRSTAQEARLADAGFVSHVHERAYRGKPLSEAQKAANTEKSRVRVRGEHVFGHIANSMNGCYVRTIGFARAKAKIGMECLAYNISRFAFLMRSHNATVAS
jgi:transposase, IS5 family